VNRGNVPVVEVSQHFYHLPFSEFFLSETPNLHSHFFFKFSMAAISKVSPQEARNIDGSIRWILHM
jgi:hypothetical protein